MWNVGACVTNILGFNRSYIITVMFTYIELLLSFIHVHMLLCSAMFILIYLYLQDPLCLVDVKPIRIVHM